MSATNADLDNLIARNRFRSDLLFRLNTLEVTLPALHQRSDFSDIAQHLLKLIDPALILTEGAADRLSRLQWPGNIRELRYILSRLSLGEGGNLIDEEAVNSLTDREHDRIGGDKLKSSLHDVQRKQILAAYAETGNNVSKAARRLGVSRNMIYRTLRSTQN